MLLFFRNSAFCNRLINGMIRVNGLSASLATGSGGSVAITAFSITGAGTIQANGGDSNNTGGGYGAGAGGRIALKLTGPGDFTGFTGLVTAYGGDSPRYLSDGAAGTIYEEMAAQAGGDTGELIVRQFSSSAQPGDGVFNRMPAGTNGNQFSTATIQKYFNTTQSAA